VQHSRYMPQTVSPCAQETTRDKLEPILAASKGCEVVVDMFALLTLHALGRLGTSGGLLRQADPAGELRGSAN